eukprot:4252323-Prymnesium_polylepis.1
MARLLPRCMASHSPLAGTGTWDNAPRLSPCGRRVRHAAHDATRRTIGGAAVRRPPTGLRTLSKRTRPITECCPMYLTRSCVCSDTCGARRGAARGSCGGVAPRVARVLRWRRGAVRAVSGARHP